MMETDERTESRGQVPPPISALFLVVFDQKIGYSIALQRTVPGLQLEGVVEYKSLPSGLHNVETDLVYFVHEQNAGISAFVSRPAGDADRGAHFATVGVLVPLSYGRLGRAWLHAAALRELAQVTVDDITNTAALDDYWQTHRLDRAGGVEQSISPQDIVEQGDESQAWKKKPISDAAGLGQDPHALSVDHPALSLAGHLEAFGPLLFPLYRAALLRKRILVLTHPPVQKACDLVYNLSVLANIPAHVSDSIPDSDAVSPIQPLFNIGVHDIVHLSKSSREGDRQRPWIACSTDDILGTKHDMYDLLVELPHEVSDGARGKQWPTLRTSQGAQIKATQRDLRRFYALEKELERIKRKTAKGYSDEDSDAEEEEHEEGEDGHDESARLTYAVPAEWKEDEEPPSLEAEAKVVEATTWAAVAYTGFLWWASAGEQDALMDDEASQEATLLSELPLPEAGRRSRGQSTSGTWSGGVLADGDEASTHAADQATAMVLIAYAHRLSAMMLETAGELVESSNEEQESNGEQEMVELGSADVGRLGLDMWSEGDKAFTKELFQVYFQKEAEVRGQSVECCGVRIC